MNKKTLSQNTQNGEGDVASVSTWVLIRRKVFIARR